MTATIDDVRAYWDRQPCNSKRSKHPIGSPEYFEDIDRNKYFVEPHILGFAEHEKWKDKYVLEIGCGIGTDAVRFARAGAHYTGIDLSEESVKLAEHRFKVLGWEGSFIVGNAEEFLPRFIYDLVYCWGMLHHTPNEVAVLRNIAKCLGVESELRLMVYAKESWKDAMVQAGLDQYEAQGGCPIAKTYTECEVEDYLWLARMEAQETTRAHIFPYQIEPYKRGEYVKEPWFEAMPPEVFAALERRFGQHLMVRATL